MNDLKPACVYMRVSTVRQAQEGTSLNDQDASTMRAAANLGYAVHAKYIDGGKSGRSDQRAEFQRMINDCCSRARPYHAVIIHDFSRFFRDDFEIEAYRRKLEKHGVELLSATQPIAPGTHARLQRAIITAMDAASSDVTAARVTSVMRTNAEEGFWNGSLPPLGYETYTAEVRGKKLKKKLRVLQSEASLVRHIFDRYLGKIGSGSTGIAKIAGELNAKGQTYRGRRFSAALVHTILTRETYIGSHFYNVQDSRTRKVRPREEWIEVKVPAIVSESDFELVKES